MEFLSCYTKRKHRAAKFCDRIILNDCLSQSRKIGYDEKNQLFINSSRHPYFQIAFLVKVGDKSPL